MALLDQIRSIFDGDPGVRKVADDPVLSAELLMLFRICLLYTSPSPRDS